MDFSPILYHGTAIENYFSRKSGCFTPINCVSASGLGVFLCFTNRCGSTLVAAEASALGYCGRPNTHLNYEFFNVDFVEEFCEAHSILTFQDYFEAVYEEFRSPLGIFFTKGSLEQIIWLKRSGVIGVAIPDIRYLRVARKDLVAQAISFVIAEQTGQWTSKHTVTSDMLTYDHQKIANAILNFAKISSDTDVYFSLIGTQPACFVYENIIGDINEVSRKLQALTGIEPLPRGPRTLDVQKQAQGVNLEWAQRFRGEALGRAPWA